MAIVEDRPFPPGPYPVLVVGSGPGGLQTSYFLSRLGIDHAVLSRDEGPGGMFRRFPLFDRLISWTKPNPDVDPGTRQEEWFDWNRLLVDEDDQPVRVAELMDGSSQFPSRGEMERALASFAERKAVSVRYDCEWTGTRREGDSFVLETSEGEYRSGVVVFAIGATEPWRPTDIPGVEDVPHYMEVGRADGYDGKSVYILGKATSAFEIADGLLPHARRMVLASPHSARLSVTERSLAGLRARYMQPMEDHAIGGRSVLLLDAATERIEKTADGYRVALMGTMSPWSMEMQFDEAIIATGVGTPVLDLPELGVQMFSRGGRLPAQTPFWESATVPGIYFAGSITQGTQGLRRATGAGAVHGFRYNAKILAQHLAEKRFGLRTERPVVAADEVVPYLLLEASTAPELWNQRAYLGRALTFDPERGAVDEGIVPLAHFVDATGPDAVAIAVISDEEKNPRAGVYLRRSQVVSEHLLEPNLTLDFTTAEHRKQLESILGS